MTQIQFNQDDIYIDGVASSTIATSLIDSGVETHKVSNFLGYLYLGFVGTTSPAPFNFDTDVDSADPRCDPKFSRTFEHLDWVDGESRVQAGLTPEELGFNGRFHAIENDFDAIEDEFGRFSGCVNEIRSDLRGVVAELEAKITDLQNQIHNLKDDGGVPPGTGIIDYLGVAKVDDRDVMITRYGDQIRMTELVEEMISGGGTPFNPGGGVIVNPGGGGVVNPGGGGVVNPGGGGVVNPGGGGVVNPGGGGVITNPGGDIIRDPGGIGGVVLNPGRPGSNPAIGGGLVIGPDSLIVSPSGVARASNQPVSVNDIVRFASDVERRSTATGATSMANVTASGDPVLGIVAANLQPDEVNEPGLAQAAVELALAGMEADERKEIRAEIIRDDAQSRSGSAVLSSSVEILTQVSESDAEALRQAGFGRVSALASATTAEVMAKLDESGTTIAPERVGAMVSTARMARTLRTI